MPRALGDQAEPAPGELVGLDAVHPAAGDEHVARRSAGAGRPPPAASWSCRRRSGRAARRRSPPGRRGRCRAARRSARRPAWMSRSSRRFTCWSPPACRGRRRAPLRSVWISAGVPTAMIWPKSSTWTVWQTFMTSCTSCSTSTTAMPSAASSCSSVGELVGLGLVLTRRRLVEQQHLRLRGERAAELDQPALAGGQRVDALVGDRRAGRRGR